MKHFYRALALFCTLALLPATALATIGPDIKARILPPSEPVVPGQPVELTVEILSEHATTLERIVLESEGWDLFSSSAPSLLQVSPQEPARFTVMGIARDASAGISVRLERNGKAYELGARVPAAELPGLEQELPRAVRTGRSDKDLQDDPGPGPAALQDEANPPAAAAAYNVTIRGSLFYQDANGTSRPLDTAKVDVWEDDVDPNPNDYITTGYTNSNGDFAITFNWDGVSEALPDLFVSFWLDNQYVRVTTTGGSLGWSTTTTWNYSGTDLNIGSWTSQLSPDPRLHHFTQNTRVARWFVARGYSHPKVDAYVVSTETSGAFYRGWTSPPEIHYGSNRQWNEDTAAHEYGHHFVRNHATAVGPDYCNGICDASATSCGHCIWCQETDHDAFSEGFPNWIADIYTREHAGLYGYSPLNFRSQESLSTCSGSYDDPWITEGFLGALCRDVEDSSQDFHFVYGGVDAMAVGKQRIIDFVADRKPTTPLEFLKYWVEEWPSEYSVLAATAQNCGYLDTTGPSLPAISPSSYQGPWDTDPTQALTITPSDDDWSGVANYHTYVYQSDPFTEVAPKDLGTATTGTSAPIPTGQWNFAVYATDRAGNNSNIFLIGPYTIIGTDGPDLEPYQAPGYGDKVVVRSTNDATSSSAPLPATLTGNAPAYYSFGVINTGGTDTKVDNSQIQVHLDGVLRAGWDRANFNPGSYWYGWNWGGQVVTGGRHAVQLRADGNSTEPEADENNNLYARQWVWTPLPAPQGTAVVRSAPPDRNAGWGGSATAFHDNVDGIRLEGGSFYAEVAAISPTSSTADYDLELHTTLSTGADDGFAAQDQLSAYGSGTTDAFVFNRNNVGTTTDYDLGVMNYDNEQANYRFESRTPPSNTPMALYQDHVVSFAAGQMAAVREIYTGAGEAGVGTAYIDGSNSSSGFAVRWFDSATTVARLADADATTSVAAGAASPASLPLSSTVDGSYSMLVITRNHSQGTAATSVTVKLRGPVNAQLPPYASTVASVYGNPDGSGQPLEQAYVWDGIPGSTPAQEDRSFVLSLTKGTDNSPLSGFPASDIGLGATGTGGTVVGCDGLIAPAGPSNGSGQVSFSGFLAGGGSTGLPNRLQLRLSDVPSVNWTGDDHVNVRFNSADINADGVVGLQDVGPFSVDYAAGSGYRSDFLRDGKVDLKDVSKFSVAVGAACPAAVPAAPSTEELADIMAMSMDDAGRVRDGKLAVGKEGTAHLWLSGPAAHDGITAWEGRLVHSDNLQVVATDLGRARLDLGEGGDHIVGMGQLARSTDAAGLRLATVRFVVTDDQPAWLGVGGSRLASAGVDLPAVVVGQEDGELAGELRAVALDAADGQALLRVNSGGAPATGDTPGEYAGLQLRNHPNPFNPATTVHFALPQAGEATVRVFDTAGRLVRTLGPASFPAGDASLHWDGQDEQGRGVNSGVYFYRFFLDGQPEGGAQRMTLLK